MSAATPITPAAFDRITDALRRLGSKQSGKMWSCLAHDDRTPSLSVGAGDGRAMVHCFAGCCDVDVLHALDLTVADLFDEPLPRRDKPHGNAPPEYMEQKNHGKGSKEPKTPKPVEVVSLDEVRRRYGRKGKITDEYKYEDEIGGEWREVLRVFRIRTDDEGGKTFRQASPEGHGWKMSKGRARLVPFHLRQLLAAKRDAA